MARFPVRNKKIYNKQDLDPRFVHYLEKWSGRNLQKLRKISPIGSPFTRWRLEGIRNISYSNNTGNKLSLLHSALRLPLQEMFGERLLRVCTEIGRDDLVLDFQGEKDIFQRIDSQAYETYKEISPSEFRSKEEKAIRIPYIKIFPTIT